MYLTLPHCCEKSNIYTNLKNIYKFKVYYLDLFYLQRRQQKMATRCPQNLPEIMSSREEEIKRLACASTANQNRGLWSTSQSELVTQTGKPDKVSDRRVRAN